MFVKPNMDTVTRGAEFMGKQEKRWFWDSSNPKGRERHISLSKNSHQKQGHMHLRQRKTEWNPKTIDKKIYMSENYFLLFMITMLQLDFNALFP